MQKINQLNPLDQNQIMSLIYSEEALNKNNKDKESVKNILEKYAVK